MTGPGRRPRAGHKAEPITVSRPPVGGWSIAAVLAVVAVMLYAIRFALLPFVFAIAIAFVVEPAVVWLVGHGRFPRWLAASLVYGLVAAALATMVYLFGAALVSDAASFVRDGGQTATELLARLFGPHGVTLFGESYSPQQIVVQAGHMLAGLLGSGALIRALGVGFFAIFVLFMLLVLLPYFMISGPRLVAGAIWLIPPERRPPIERLLPRIIPVLRRYLVGVLAVVSYAAFVVWVGFGLVFSLPHAVLLAITIGLLEVIPVIGPVTAIALAVLAAVQHGSGLAGVAEPIAFIVIVRLSIDNLVGPLVLGQAARVHPVVVIFAFVCGGMLFGAIGLLLAVPSAVTLKIALQHYYAEPIESGVEPPRK